MGNNMNNRYDQQLQQQQQQQQFYNSNSGPQQNYEGQPQENYPHHDQQQRYPQNRYEMTMNRLRDTDGRERVEGVGLAKSSAIVLECTVVTFWRILLIM